MRYLLRIGSMFIFAAKRLASQRGLAVANLVGLVSFLALVMSIPTYVDAVYDRLLREGLLDREEAQPPLSFTFHYFQVETGGLPWEDVRPADDYFSGPVTSDLGLPRQLLVRFFRTGRFMLFSQDSASYTDAQTALTTIRFGAISGLQDHVTLVDGVFPTTASSSVQSAVDVLLSESLARKTGLDVGETYIAFAAREPSNVQIPIRIAGIWRATDPDETYWFRAPDSLQDICLVPEETFTGRLGLQIEDHVHEALWYLVVDDTQIRPDDIGPLIRQIGRVQARVFSRLPQLVITTPLAMLVQYQRSARLLALLLYIFSVPLVGLDLVFIGAVTRMSVEGRKNEIAVMLSRGAIRSQVVGISLLEGLLLALLALAIGAPGSVLVARLATSTRSFLDFSARGEPQIVFAQDALYIGLIAAAFSLVAQVVPAARAARHTVVVYRQERARALRPPWWQRAGLDLLLLVPAAYGSYLLRQQGSLTALVEGSAAADPFQNPLLFLVPFVTVLALTLLLVRFVPLLVSTLAWLAAQTRSIGFLLATRQLSRTPGYYAAPLLLLVITLSLSTFVSSAARSMDRRLYDQMRYRGGAEMVLYPKIEAREADEEALDYAQPTDSVRIPNWFYVPLSDYAAIPGVAHAARVQRYWASPAVGGAARGGTFMGIDRSGFGRIAFWQPDFAPQSLGTLMNALAVARDGVLVPRSTLDEHNLRVGDTLPLIIMTYGQEAEYTLQIVGSFDLFPTWNPEWGPLFVGNLDYLFEQIGTELPASVWLTLDAGADRAQIEDRVRQLNPTCIIQQPLYGEIVIEQQRPVRKGLIGMLSIGFAAAAMLATLGLLLYALFSFKRRSVELGTLKSLGLSFRQMSSYLAWEWVFLLLIGLAGGTALGLAISNLWIPYFKAGTDEWARVLPPSVDIAWSAVAGIYLLFGLLLIAILALSVAMSRRFRLADAVKLMDTT